MRCCVRRSFEAATISMAFVIFCVFLTLAILVRISLPLAIYVPLPPLSKRRVVLKPSTSFLELGRDLVVVVTASS